MECVVLRYVPKTPPLLCASWIDVVRVSAEMHANIVALYKKNNKLREQGSEQNK